MHRARVKAVSGNKVLADGMWLTCVGNRTVREGEWIWTDGRCVYGHESEGGNSYIPTNVLSGVPILQLKWKDHKDRVLHSYYAKGKIHSLGFSKEETWMVNSSRHFAYVSGYGMLDAEMDERGNLYTIEAVNVLVFPLIGVDQRDSILSVKCNGEIIAAYDLVQMFGAPAVSDPTDFYRCQTVGGRVDKEGNFKVMIWHATAERGENGSYVSTDRYVFFDGSNLEPWMENTKTTSSDSVTGESHTSESRWIAPDYSVRYPIHDGMYMRFPANLDYLISGKKYISKIYSAKDELLMELETNPTARTSLCPLGQGKYLVSMVPSSILGNETSELYLWEDGQLTLLMKGCLNRRLRRMSNLNKWKKAGGFR